MAAALHLLPQTVCELEPDIGNPFMALRNYRTVVDERYGLSAAESSPKVAELRLVSTDGVIMGEGDSSPAENRLYDPRDPLRRELTRAAIKGIRATQVLERTIDKQPLSPVALLARRAVGRFSLLYATHVIHYRRDLVAPRLLQPSQAAALERLQPQLAGHISEVAQQGPIRLPLSATLVDEFNIDKWQEVVKNALKNRASSPMPEHGVIAVVSNASYQSLGEALPNPHVILDDID